MSNKSNNSTQIVCKSDFYTFFIASKLENATVIFNNDFYYFRHESCHLYYNSQSRMKHFKNSTTRSKRKRRNLKFSIHVYH